MVSPYRGKATSRLGLENPSWIILHYDALPVPAQVQDQLLERPLVQDVIADHRVLEGLVNDAIGGTPYALTIIIPHCVEIVSHTGDTTGAFNIEL